MSRWRFPGVGSSSPEGFGAIAEESNGVLDRLGIRIQWVQSCVATEKTFCANLAESEEPIREQARLSGFPANRLTEGVTFIAPSTAPGDTLSGVA
ncbi:MAG: DUF4242 domain-containing protein [Chromatiales bacterium]